MRQKHNQTARRFSSIQSPVVYKLGRSVAVKVQSNQNLNKEAANKLISQLFALQLATRQS